MHKALLLPVEIPMRLINLCSEFQEGLPDFASHQRFTGEKPEKTYPA